MTEHAELVVDASIVARWHLKNPPYLNQSLLVENDFRHNRLSLVAPSNMVVEVAGAIYRAIKTRAVSQEPGEQRIQELINLDIPTVDSRDLLLPAYEIASHFGCSFYDGIYLAVSKRLGLRFVHADESLKRALRG
jgi:predicted nucleic acid-binding protein